MNDLTELHQNEIENIKSGVTDMEEKVQYQSEERVRDIQEQLATLETTSPGRRHCRPPLRSRRDNRNYCSQFLCCLSQLGYKLVTIL